MAGPVTVLIRNKRGLHARASARFVTLASTFDAVVTVAKDDSSVVGTSIMGLMMLAAAPGDTVELSAEGEQADEALAALVALVEGKFGED
ncbi:HPr family phosphocarrier protein [Polymorphobacter megasporae]|uniref:HPr family phosphocarrier protein n=1 Tax=Polymorphobacter sp. PAMC 29334 TaxID=2862331 RepID=UPI001C1DD561|nr:HPr family phosphocarrier protein [Polymorphobacter sp. PAMC 29334]QYE35799.1 HPr family phosphocarrier protein [Polymorphobacter sp. PAMC 29334]UAJ10830.1 HPr family phosphocarrier protein [Polymorphobacter megasporae]